MKNAMEEVSAIWRGIFQAQLDEHGVNATVRVSFINDREAAYRTSRVGWGGRWRRASF